jgi:Domain of unknown function (DUF4340)
MRFRSTLVLAIIFFALGAYLYFVEFQRAEEEAKKKTLFSFETEEVTKVELTYPDRQIVVQKEDGSWQLTAPIEAAADKVAVDNLVRAVADCEVKKSLDDVPENLAPFGLDTPKVTVTLTLGDHALPAIRVGKTSPVGASTYIQRADEPKIYLTSSAFQSGMEKQVKDLRDKSILHVKSEDVRRITIERADSHLLLRKTDGGWQITEPAQYDADDTAVRSFLSSLGSLRANDFPSETDAELGKYGLETPRLTIRLAIGEDEAETQILFGNTDEKDKSVYVKVGSRPTIFTVGDWSYENADKGLNDFRDKTILAFDESEVSAIDVTRADGASFAIERKDDAWTLPGSAKSPSPELVDRFLRDLKDLKGYEIADENPTDLGTYGLDSPSLTITVRGKDSTLGVARFGSYQPQPPATEYTAQHDREATVFRVREYEFTRLDKKADDFLPKPTAQPGSEEEAPNVDADEM